MGEAAALGGDATWNLSPVDNTWNNPLNWTPNTIPGAFDTATFNASNVTDITFSSTSSILQMSFTQSASSYTFTVNHLDVVIFTEVGPVNNSGTEQHFECPVDEMGNAGAFSFEGNSSAGVQTFFSVDARTTFSGLSGAAQFLDSGSAGNGTFTIKASSLVGDSVGAQAAFFASSDAGNATIINEGATVNGAGGGATFFYNQTRALNATLIANSGSGGGGGGLTQFWDNAAGDTARIELFGNGLLDLTHHRSSMGVGSIEGDGLVFLGSHTLTLGTNGLNTTFSGVIDEGTGSGGSLEKAGSGTFTLSGANTYSGSTTLSAGTLIVSNRTGSATGTGSVKANVGTLGGSGIIAGTVTVGTGSGGGAFLTPGIGTNKQVTLTIQSALTFSSDSTYTYTFKGNRNRVRTDLVIANGVTINRGTIAISSSSQNRIRRGTVLTVISNTSASPISGTFSNLADGAIINVNGNNLQADYSGGDGNDLTLTVVP